MTFYKAKHQQTYTSTTLFKFTEREHTKINVPFRNSLERLKQNKGNQTDWFNVFFRVMGAFVLTKNEYEDCTVQELKKVVDICEAIEIRARATNHKVWEVTQEEGAWLDAAFDAMEELQRTVPRKRFHSSAVEVEKYLKDKYVAGKHWKKQ